MQDFQTAASVLQHRLPHSAKTASADFAAAGYKIDFEIAFENRVLKKARDRFRGKTGNAAGL